MSSYVWGNTETKFFFELTPDTILSAVGQKGFDVSGRLLPMNSMENRVYEIEIDNASEFADLTNNFIVTKFYRPGRWSKEQILDEHQFLLELKEEELNVIAPIVVSGETLFKIEGHNLYFAVFPKKGGRVPDEMNYEGFEMLGRMLARLHNIGDNQKESSRLKISEQTYGLDNLNYLLSNKIIPEHQENIYADIVREIADLSKPLFKNIKYQRIHGDCHAQNIISREDEGLFLIDFDDMLIGPAVQDIWLITPGRDDYDRENRFRLIEGYESMRDFNYRELKLVESLRALRFIHFTAWIANRWDDPAFQVAFSHFKEPNYWDVQIQDLKDQLELIKNQANEY